jgi:hypothetical protein
MKLGVWTLMVFVTFTNEVYKRRIVNDAVNKIMNNLVDIGWFRSSCSSLEGGIDGNKLRFCKKNLDFCHNVVARIKMFAIKMTQKYVVVSSKKAING